MKNLKTFREFINENGEAPAAGLATLASTPGMGPVVMPTDKIAGSGDIPSATLGKKKRLRRKKTRLDFSIQQPR